MPRNISHTPLNAAPQEAFDYLTTPACWHEWHPASLGTVPDDRLPQPKDARFEENIHTAGFRRCLRWRVIDAQRPDYWEAEASMDDGSQVRLRYDFAPSPQGTDFIRTLDYRIKPLWLRAIDLLIGRFRVRRESAVAMQALQRRFEASRPSGWG